MTNRDRVRSMTKTRHYNDLIDRGGVVNEKNETELL